ncbi:MAG: hypothetical protein VZS44_02030 [Bacilli bacterium]|nr:hypothetical protein [Bacilli bacterium]
MEYNSIKNKLTKENIIGEGKEIVSYKIDNNIIKIFHKDRKSGLDIISREGLEKLTRLNLNCFNTPKELIYENGQVVGYIEDYIEDNFLNKELLKDNLDLLYEDIITLSENGFIINDIQYNYLSNNKTFKFIDMTSYNYFNINNIKSEIGKETIKKKIINDNINTINIFLIGLFEYDAFHKGEHFELTKTNKAVMFNLEKCNNIYYGEYLKQNNNRGRKK